MKGITYCGECADYDRKKHRCRRGASLESRPQDKFYDECPLADVVPVVRCRDCKYSYEDISGRFCSHGPCAGWAVLDDSFCGQGERRGR
nr:MAG TPA: hypothetical protein [Caudoviricetes sp.]